MSSDRQPFDLEPYFIKKWVIPFYMSIYRPANNELLLKEATRVVWHDLDAGIAGRLLATPDWRSRSTGAFFAAVKRFRDLQPRLIELLLASDRVYADRLYCYALAMMNDHLTVASLRQYLDQDRNAQNSYSHTGDALGALLHLDNANATSVAQLYTTKWMPLEDPGVRQFGENLLAVRRIADFAAQKTTDSSVDLPG